jgi:hypothetical protein
VVTLKGHGKEINDISVHSQDPRLILTASKVNTGFVFGVCADWLSQQARFRKEADICS